MSGFDPSELVHAGIAGLTPYEPGKPIEAVAREYGLDEVVKLASNENPWGPSPKAVRRLQEVATEMHRYPDGPCTALRDALAQRTGIAADRLIFGNGSAEILELALRTFVQAGQTVASAEVSFSMYGILARAIDARYVSAPMDGVAYDLEALAKLVTAKRARLVFVANPNNPTGTAFGADRLHDFLGRIPDGTVVVYDAAYAEYGAAADIPDGLDLVDRYDNVIVTRTFSKAYGLAGLRVGWAVASPAVADYLNRVRQPFNVNRAAQEAAVAALDDGEFLEMVLRAMPATNKPTRNSTMPPQTFLSRSASSEISPRFMTVSAWAMVNTRMVIITT